MNQSFPKPLGFRRTRFRARKESALERWAVSSASRVEWTRVKYLSRFVKIESRGLCLEYGLIAGAMGLALLAVTPILANSLSVALGR